MDFQQDIESQGQCFARKVIQRLAGEAFGDQQDRVGSGPASLQQLPAIHHEVLSEHRDLHRGLHGLQILQRAAEVGLVGEAGDGGGPGSLVGRDHLLRGGSRADFSTGRGFALELRDDAEGARGVQSVDQ